MTRRRPIAPASTIQPQKLLSKRERAPKPHLFIQILHNMKNNLRVYNCPAILSSVTLFGILCLAPTLTLANKPPQFVLSEGQSEIVLRLKEGKETPVGSLIYTLKGFDFDNDPLTFGLRGQIANELLRIENLGSDEANVYLKKELDREVCNIFQKFFCFIAFKNRSWVRTLP